MKNNIKYNEIVDMKKVMEKRLFITLKQMNMFGSMDIDSIKTLRIFLHENSSLYTNKPKFYFHELISKIIQKSINEIKLKDLKNFPIGSVRNMLCSDGLELTSWFNKEYYIFMDNQLD